MIILAGMTAQTVIMIKKHIRSWCTVLFQKVELILIRARTGHLGRIDLRPCE